ncbi:uncharacterized protein LOC111411887 [Olea europaea var. sylvestris]|uniref:Uncharacterized protein n=1 Tax=Olea europaea subsp. europaea TaxID=158383 RepID=A0A8S0TW70_OLEEU|nr:uncharacterized protein LOC111411887 [Olea europaea var. sylvestris]CAA3009317.1 Hypothetical predicted protein [Olea europaea subsp. europaea]
MNSLDSPLEALAFNYLSYGLLTAVNSIWPWIAVLTAAVSFWRIRASSSSNLSTRARSPDSVSTSSSSPLKMDEGAVEAAVGCGDGEVATVSSTQSDTEYLSGSNKKCRVLEREGSTKGKFTLYYSEKDEFKTGEGDDNGGGNGAREVTYEKMGRWCDDWERMMMVKMADMGWYQYQDLTVLDGSVVRLWDSKRQINAAAVGGDSW